jgi:phage tail sheath protein FI
MRAIVGVVMLTTGMGLAPQTASGAPQTAPNGQARKVAVASPANQQYLSYLRKSLTQGTQWAAFENNNPQLWSRVSQTANNFLTSEWQQGKLKGQSRQMAFYVKCDSSTMTQNDIDNGRLILVVGVALQKPAEFVTIRINQQTARHR